MTITPEEYTETKLKLHSLENQLKVATQFIAEFAEGAQMADNLIAQLQSELVEAYRQRNILLNAIQHLRRWDPEFDLPPDEIAQKAWDEAQPSKLG